VTARKTLLHGSLRSQLQSLEPLLAQTDKWGQTRFLSYGMGGADGENFIRDPDGAPDAPTGWQWSGIRLARDAA
jgi:hypothetical protein